MNENRIICHIYLSLGLFILIIGLMFLVDMSVESAVGSVAVFFGSGFLLLLIPGILLVRSGQEGEQDDWAQFLATDASYRYLANKDKKRLFAEFQAKRAQMKSPQ